MLTSVYFTPCSKMSVAPGSVAFCNAPSVPFEVGRLSSYLKAPPQMCVCVSRQRVEVAARCAADGWIGGMVVVD